MSFFKIANPLQKYRFVGAQQETFEEKSKFTLVFQTVLKLSWNLFNASITRETKEIRKHIKQEE